MRSSRRTLGLQPEIIPEDDSQDNSNNNQSIDSESEENIIERQEEEDEEELTVARSEEVRSEDVNIQDSSFSKVYSDSDSDLNTSRVDS